MSHHEPYLNAELAEYLQPKLSRHLDALAQHIAKSAPAIQISRLQASFLQQVIRIQNSQAVLELGTYFGYSALAMADALQGKGHLWTVDISDENLPTAQSFWHKAKLFDRITSIVMDASAYLQQCKSKGQSFDLIFIDANKSGTHEQVRLAKSVLRSGGILVVDNVLWRGEVLSPNSKNAKSMVELNAALAQDPDFNAMIVPLGDGMLLATFSPSQSSAC